MIETTCRCGAKVTAPESSVGQTVICQRCSTRLHVVAAEALPEGSGAADFDARLLIRSGPTKVGEIVLLGGVPDITLGKLPDNQIVLPGNQVSRLHARLVRLDFAPSRWELHDNNSTNHLFINAQLVTGQELRSGDIIGVGEYELEFILVVDQPVPVMALPAEPLKPARVLTYGGADPVEAPLLGDADPQWVINLKNATSFMLWAIGINTLSFCIPRDHGLKIGIDFAVSLLNWFAAWLLTMPEPGAPESQKWVSLRMSLRVAASVKVVGEILRGLSLIAQNEAIELVGILLALAYIPQLFIFLFYLRLLALRLPNRALAINSLIVMIGLPASVALLMAGAIVLLSGPSANLVFAGLAMLAGIGGFIVFEIWYVVLLIWFKSCFS